jgi:hypothetical protein
LYLFWQVSSSNAAAQKQSPGSVSRGMAINWMWLNLVETQEQPSPVARIWQAQGPALTLAIN